MPSIYRLLALLTCSLLLQPLPVLAQSPHVAHVASVREPDAVPAAFDELRLKYPSVFAGLHARTTSVTLPNGQTWHRVLIAPMRTTADADQFCRSLLDLGHDYCKILPGGDSIAAASHAQTTSPAPPPPLPPGTTDASPLTRHALVIGISDYANVPRLVNPRNDARAIANALRVANFNSVKVIQDPSLSGLRGELEAFAAVARRSDVAMIYFAGHGLEINGQNYLIPRDATIGTPESVRDEAVTLESVLAAIDGARKLKLVVLDACRDNPFVARLRQEATRSLGATVARARFNDGLAPVATGQNTLVAYAAKHGSTATDGDGDNSPYAKALLEVLAVEGLETGLLFRRVRDRVLALTDQGQEPFTYGSISGEAIFLRPTVGGLTLPSPGVRYEQFERETVERMREVARMIGTKDFTRLASMIHPIKGLRVTPDSNIDINADQLVTRRDLLAPSARDKSRVWGIQVNDEPIKGTFAEYIANWAYKRNYASVEKASFMDRQEGAGEYTNNIYAVYPGSLVLDLHLTGTAQYSGMDWSSLRLVFEQYNGKWFLVGMLNAQWNP